MYGILKGYMIDIYFCPDFFLYFGLKFYCLPNKITGFVAGNRRLILWLTSYIGLGGCLKI